LSKREFVNKIQREKEMEGAGGKERSEEKKESGEIVLRTIWGRKCEQENPKMAKAKR